MLSSNFGAVLPSVKRRPWQDKRQVDAQGFTLMTLSYLQQLCKDQGGYSTPELNDKAYLHFKGFARLEHIERFTGLKSLWLEGNAISVIENIDQLAEMRCLFLQENCIEHLSGLANLLNLSTLNVSNNMLRSLGSELSCLPNLSTLQVANNKLSTVEDIAVLSECQSLSVLDLSNNVLGELDVFDVIYNIPQLAVLNLMGNPAIRKAHQYRRNLIVNVKTLTYLDDRPIFDGERRATEAWAEGGLEGERNERQRQRDVEKEEQRVNFEALRQLQEEHRQIRRANGENVDAEPTFAPHLEGFRDQMLERIGLDSVATSAEDDITVPLISNDRNNGSIISNEDYDSKSISSITGKDLDTLSTTAEASTSERDEEDSYTLNGANSIPVRLYSCIDNNGKALSQSESFHLPVEEIFPSQTEIRAINPLDDRDQTHPSVLQCITHDVQRQHSEPFEVDSDLNDTNEDSGFLIREFRSKNKSPSTITSSNSASVDFIPIQETSSTALSNVTDRVLIEELKEIPEYSSISSNPITTSNDLIMSDTTSVQSYSYSLMPNAVPKEEEMVPRTNHATVFTQPSIPVSISTKRPRPLSIDVPAPSSPSLFANAFNSKEGGTVNLPSPLGFVSTPVYSLPLPSPSLSRIMEEEMPRAPPSTPTNVDFSATPFFPKSSTTTAPLRSPSTETSQSTVSGRNSVLPMELDEELFLPKAPPSTPIGGEFSLTPFAVPSSMPASFSNEPATPITAVSMSLSCLLSPLDANNSSGVVNSSLTRPVGTSAVATSSRLRQAMVISDTEDTDDEQETTTINKNNKTEEEIPLLLPYAQLILSQKALDIDLSGSNVSVDKEDSNKNEDENRIEDIQLIEQNSTSTTFTNRSDQHA